MSDSAGFVADTDSLRTSATNVRAIATDIVNAGTLSGNGMGHRDDFGLLANSMHVGDRHDAFLEAVTLALSTGGLVTNDIAGDLEAVAQAYDDSDVSAQAQLQGTGG